MKIVKCNDDEFNQIKNGKQNFKIFYVDDYKFLEEIKLENSLGEKITVKITAINKYNKIQSVLKIVELNKFGDYNSDEEFIDKMNGLYDLSNEFLVCRVKISDDSLVDIEDKEVLNYINIDTLEKITIGLSGCDVFKVGLKDGSEGILKVKKLSNGDKLKDEADVLDFLDKKVNVSKNIYYNVYNKKEYLLRECLEGKPLYEFKDFGFKLGQELKKFHELYDENITFDVFSTDVLLNHVIDNIEIVYNQRDEKFKDYSIDQLKDFLIENKPENDSLIHGDFSLTNILKKDEDFYYIDLAGVSKSTKYFDIYVFIKSLKINNLENELDGFLKGYGIEKLNENYLDWMRFIELSYS